MPRAFLHVCISITKHMHACVYRDTEPHEYTCSYNDIIILILNSAIPIKCIDIDNSPQSRTLCCLSLPPIL